ncbi:MAG: regulator of sigma protease [Deferribacteres bacterium]|jgi:regulator of sigma E protease|nr:regulator of sigma protease [Deferribacteres bacterium]
MGIIAAIVVFGLLVFFHELGHFLFAKYFKVYVEKFSIGFGPDIVSKKYGETVYSISAIPLGGYVKMFGEDIKADIPQEMKAKAFSHKPLYQRALIVFAGPLFNFILAIVLFAVINMVGMPMLLPVIDKVQAGMPAFSAGINSGDKIIKINDKEIKYWDEMSSIIKENPGKPLIVTVLRGQEELTFTITPKLSKSRNLFGEEVSVGLIGVTPKDRFVTVRYNPIDAINKGLEKTYEVTKLTVVGIIKIFQKVVPADNIGGPIMIFQMAKQTAQIGINSLLAFMAVISINLAILNLLPVPVLDGGHLLFYLIEAVFRRPVSIKVREYANMVGIALLLALMMFAFYNDIIRIIKN